MSAYSLIVISNQRNRPYLATIGLFPLLLFSSAIQWVQTEVFTCTSCSADYFSACASDLSGIRSSYPCQIVSQQYYSTYLYNQ